MTANLWGKIEALERLARNPAAPPGEQRNARRAAARLRSRSPTPAPAPAAPPAPPPSPAYPDFGGRVRPAPAQPFGQEEPPHGPRCPVTARGELSPFIGGCVECWRIEQWRSWRARGGGR